VERRPAGAVFLSDTRKNPMTFADIDFEAPVAGIGDALVCDTKGRVTAWNPAAGGCAARRAPGAQPTEFAARPAAGSGTS